MRVRTGCEWTDASQGQWGSLVFTSVKRKAEDGDKWGCGGGGDHWRDLYVALRSLDYTHWWKKRKILGMIYAEFWSSKISVPSGGRRIRHLVVSPGGRPWVHKPGQYCRDRYEGAKSGTRNEESAEPIITTGEGEESPRLILLLSPLYDRWPISQYS